MLVFIILLLGRGMAGEMTTQVKRIGCDPATNNCSTTPIQFQQSDEQQSQSQCTLYDSRITQNFNVYERCQIAAEAENSAGLFACKVAQEVSNLLQSCYDKESFDNEFEVIVRRMFQEFQSWDGSQVASAGVAFEPYTFENKDFYGPYVNNGDVHDENIFGDIIDNYNYYNECLEGFGEECMWYNIAKEKTFYKGTGGIWLITRSETLKGIAGTSKAFDTPVILDGRFYGIAWVRVFIV
eukprot:TRINITY_DN1861_c0_g1_i9.p2 TRINITY_DN1861_c0_g1~~TRINITY_DN1861_c0_g1_i9.p2  ORF type:complete len:239 (+),score=18.99 TRINITY_DN1861_c0_g1_i9:109-825(+)